MGGRGWAGWSGVKGGKWDNCNSIINKYIFLKENLKNTTNYPTMKFTFLKSNGIFYDKEMVKDHYVISELLKKIIYGKGESRNERFGWEL